MDALLDDLCAEVSGSNSWRRFCRIPLDGRVPHPTKLTTRCPVEFGFKARLIDNDDGIVLDYCLEAGNPPDGPQLAPVVTRVARRACRVPRAVPADRGYGQPAAERDLRELGVRIVAMPRQSATSPSRKTIEHGRGFRRLVKWRTGCEGRISYLKRGYG